LESRQRIGDNYLILQPIEPTLNFQIYNRYLQPSNEKMCMYCWLSRCHKSFRFAKVRLILLGYVKTAESNSRVQGDIGLKSLFLSVFTMRKGLHDFPGDRIFTFYWALGQICDTAAMLFTRRASEFYIREHIFLIQ